jgi:hypothetical protein
MSHQRREPFLVVSRNSQRQLSGSQIFTRPIRSLLNNVIAAQAIAPRIAPSVEAKHNSVGRPVSSADVRHFARDVEQRCTVPLCFGTRHDTLECAPNRSPQPMRAGEKSLSILRCCRGLIDQARLLGPPHKRRYAVGMVELPQSAAPADRVGEIERDMTTDAMDRGLIGRASKG